MSLLGLDTRLKKIPFSTLGRRESYDEFSAKWREQAASQLLMAERPLVSVVVSFAAPVDQAVFSRCLASLKSQSYQKIEVLFSLAHEFENVASLIEQEDEHRFQVFRTNLVGEVALKNFGIQEATGEWVIFLSPDEVMSPVAVFEFLLAVGHRREASFFYSNEAIVDLTQKSCLRFLSKPDFSWFNLLHFNFVGHLWMVRRSLLVESGGFVEKAGRHHEHDLFLRLFQKTRQFQLVPFFLVYRLKDAILETLSGNDSVLERMLHSNLTELGIPAEVSTLSKKDLQFPKLTPNGRAKSKSVSAVICFRDKAEWTIRCARALAEQNSESLREIILVNNDSSLEELKKVEAFLTTLTVSTKIVHYSAPFNFARMNNLAAREYSTGEYILFLNNDVFWSSRGALDEVALWAEQDWVGTVGIHLQYGHGGTQYAGIRAYYGGEARMARIGHDHSENHFAFLSREVFANTLALCLMRRSVFESVGGLQELEMVNGFGDVAFHFETLKRGFRHLYLGHLSAVHLESASRGMEYEYWEEFTIEERYPDILQRMLRRDLGYDRVPAVELSIRRAIHQKIQFWLRQNDWIGPAKNVVKQMLRLIKSQSVLKRAEEI